MASAVTFNTRITSNQLVKLTRQLSPGVKRRLVRLLEKETAQQDSINTYSRNTNRNNSYKIRLAITSKDKGKSGGARVISYVVTLEERVILLSSYDKAEQEDTADAFMKQLLKERGF